jgi:hypothetical protein
MRLKQEGSDGNIQHRARKTGAFSYRVQVRLKGQSLTKTVATRTEAR